jgi:hypothetical protein
MFIYSKSEYSEAKSTYTYQTITMQSEPRSSFRSYIMFHVCMVIHKHTHTYIFKMVQYHPYNKDENRRESLQCNIFRKGRNGNRKRSNIVNRSLR